MDVVEYAQHDATGLAELIRGKEVTVEEVHAAARAAIELVNPTINALSQGPWEKVLEHRCDGRFAGVPFALKDDPGCHAAGVRYRYGSRLTGAGITFGYDTYAMQRFRDSGLAALGVTTVPEFLAFPDTVTKVNGATRNPWDPTRSVGGSSGGAAAIVASGALPIAHASDGGGSIRVPASWNGVVGLKPSRGRVSLGPDKHEVIGSGLGYEFVITRTLRDCAAMLDSLSGSMPGDPFMIESPGRPWEQELKTPPRRLRVAVCTRAFSGETDPEVAAVVEGAARTLEQLGHHVDTAAPDIDWERFMAGFAPMAGAGIYAFINGIAMLAGRKPNADTLEAASLAAYRYGTDVTVDEILFIGGPINNICQAFGEFFARWDLLLTPTTQVPAQPLGYLNEIDPEATFDRWLNRYFEKLATFTPLFNITGGPALSLPLGQTSDCLPVGVQLATPMCDEATLFQVAAQLEEALPWADRRPTIHPATAQARR
jgi:amidase